MQLDGDDVLLGDLIFDILLGAPGVVVTLGAASFTVDYGNGRQLTYSGNGLVANVRRAYWRSPILTIPRKADPQWPLLQAVVNTIREQA